MPQADSHPTDHHPSDDPELIVVPKGKSKKQFLLTLGLMLFVLLIFTVGGSFQSSMGGIFGGEESDPVYLSWVDPLTKTKHEVRYGPFQRRFTALDTLHSIGLFQPRHVPAGKRRPRVSPEDVGLILVLDQMAKDAGIQVSAGEFRQFLSGAFQTADNVRMVARQRRLTVPLFESILRDQLRVSKLMGFMEVGVSTAADATKVEELWKEQHPQYSFQYVEVEGAQFLEEARAQVPDDETLLAWFHDQPLFKQQVHFDDASYGGTVAYVPLDEDFDATVLLERFPAPEGLDPEVQARSYYNRFNNVRFKTEPAPEAPEEDAGEGTDEAADEGGDESPGDALEEALEEAVEEVLDGALEETLDPVAADEEEIEEEPQDQPLYKPYEDVAEQCRREAPLQAALTAWLSDLRTRMNEAPEDAPLDFATEAEAVGLKVARIDEPLSKSDFETQEPWGGKFLANQFTYAVEGELLSSVVLEEHAIVAGQLTTKIDRKEPPLEQIREALSEEWAVERSATLAVEMLDAVRDAFGERPVVDPDADPLQDQDPWLPSADADAFKAAAEAAGFEVVDRPWLERFAVPDDDYEAMTPADQTIRVSAEWFDLEAGQVPAAVADTEKAHAILVRFAGERDRPFAEIKATDLLRLRQQASGAATGKLGETLFRFDSDWFKNRFQVTFKVWDQAAETEGSEDADADASADSSGTDESAPE